MIRSEVWKIAIEALRANKVKAFLTMLGVVIGSACIVLVVMTPDFQAIRNLLVTQGRYFDDDDMKSRSKVCLLTEELARVVFPGVDPLGREMRVGELRFTIIGVFKERVATFGQSEIARESVIVPFGLLKSYAGTDTVKVLYAQAATPDMVPAVTNGVEQ